jgi:hypothetical protein
VADQRRLHEVGWIVLDRDPDTSVLEVGAMLGAPVPSRRGGPLVDELRPTHSSNARHRSLSATHGLGAFPLHTDAAYMKVPPRFLLLAYQGESRSSRATVVLDFMALPFSRDERTTLLDDVWRVDGGPTTRFLASVLSDRITRRTKLVRFDEGCMAPASTAFLGSQRLVQRLLLDSKPQRIAWTPGRILVLDNWRVLHGRAPSTHDDSGARVLERVLVS